LAIDIPGNVAVGGAVIGNNRTKGKPLGHCRHLANASFGWQKSAHNLWKSLVNQCRGTGRRHRQLPGDRLARWPAADPHEKGAGIAARPKLAVTLML
jgi:hypothetical protein